MLIGFLEICSPVLEIATSPPLRAAPRNDTEIDGWVIRTLLLK
jgi:hypothetical protein